MAYRKAKGFCFKCEGKWGPQHKCPAAVPLHMIEEVWQLIAEADGVSPADPQSQSNSDPDELMAISKTAFKGINVVRTLKLHAYIGQHQAVILVDSGSSHNFISEQMAAKFQPWLPLRQGLSMKVADGAQLPCTHELVNCPWSAQGTMFTSTFKILPLQCYDAILGMEWLES